MDTRRRLKTIATMVIITRNNTHKQKTLKPIDSKIALKSDLSPQKKSYGYRPGGQESIDSYTSLYDSFNSNKDG